MPPGVRVLTCDNPSPMTLTGTNTYLLGTDAAPEIVVIDPGPEGHPEHYEAIMQAAGGQPIGLIAVTHRHHDHFGGAAGLAEATGAPVRAFDPALCSGAAALRPGERFDASGVEVEVLHTPGHTSDSVCFWLPQAEAMITGDTILGEGTTMLDYPTALSPTTWPVLISSRSTRRPLCCRRTVPRGRPWVPSSASTGITGFSDFSRSKGCWMSTGSSAPRTSSGWSMPRLPVSIIGCWS